MIAQDTTVFEKLTIENITIQSSRIRDTEPVSFQRIDNMVIERIYYGQDPAALLQQLSPSIVSYSDGGTDMGNYAQFRLRGIDQDRINISLNGVPLNDMIDHGVYFSNFSDFLNSVHSVQVQRGVAADKHGVASFAGSVNFESARMSQESPSTDVQMGLASFGTRRISAEVHSGTLAQGVSLYTRMSHFRTDGYKYNSGAEAYSLFLSGGYVGSKDMIKITALAGKTQNGQAYEYVPISDILVDPRTNFNGLNDIDDFAQQQVQIQHARQINHLNLNTTYYYNGAFGVFPYTFDNVQYMYGLNNKHHGLMSTISGEHAQSDWSAGIHAYTMSRTNTEHISPFSTDPYQRDLTDKKEISAFGKYNVRFGKWHVHASGQLRHISMINRYDLLTHTPDIEQFDRSWLFINGVGGLHYQASQANSFYLSLGYSNREPTRTDLLNGVSAHERVRDIELGWRHRRNKYSLEVNVFDMSFRNEISKIGALVERSYMEIRQNVPHSRRYGLEMMAQLNMSAQFFANLTGSLMGTNISEYQSAGTDLRNIEHILAPRFIITPTLNYTPYQRLSLMVMARHVSSSFTELSNNPDFTLPAYTVLNSQINYQLSSSINLQLTASNIFNTLYFAEGRPTDRNFDGTIDEMGFRIQPPRNFSMMIRMSF